MLSNNAWLHSLAALAAANAFNLHARLQPLEKDSPLLPAPSLPRPLGLVGQELDPVKAQEPPLRRKRGAELLRQDVAGFLS
jgi:hypothetical protein